MLPGAAPGKGSGGSGGGLGGRGSKPFKLPTSLTYTPDYQSLLQSDPAFSVLKQSLSAQGIQDAAQRRAGINQALIQYGGVPNFAQAAGQLGLSHSALQQLMGDIDPNTAALAAANTRAGLSEESQLNQQQQQAMLALRNNLAARGALSSGDDAYRTNLQDQAYAQAQNQALQSLLGAINGFNQNYTTAQQTEQGQLDQGIQQALQNQEALGTALPASLTYHPKLGKYTTGAGGTYTIHRHGGRTTLTSDQTGQTLILNRDGTLSAL